MKFSLILVNLLWRITGRYWFSQDCLLSHSYLTTAIRDALQIILKSIQATLLFNWVPYLSISKLLAAENPGEGNAVTTSFLNSYFFFNYWVMHPVARVSINIYRHLRTQQMSVPVLLCTSYTTCFGPCWWPSSGGFVTQKKSKAVTVCQRIRCVSMLICKLDINI
jgi:hypothetical protein